MRRRIGYMLLAAMVAGLASGPAAAQAPQVPGRGELLYANHCIACHTEQLHWRDGKIASTWPRLKEEVRRWQAAAQLGWSEADILDVTYHLNETIYHLPQTDDVVGRRATGEAVAAVAPKSR